jgi:NADH:ubiquinone oxidoreductase subunit K
MIAAIYFVALSFAALGAGMAGVAASRHFLIIMLSVEIAMTGSMMLAAASFRYSSPGDIIGLMFSMWAVASAEIIVMVAIYRHMARNGISMDVSRLSKLGDR